MRDGWLYLVFRVGNLRTKSNIIETHVTAKMVYPRKNAEDGEQLSFDQEELKVKKLSIMIYRKTFGKMKPWLLYSTP